MLKDYTAYGVIAAGDGQTLVGTLQQSRGQTLPMNMAHTVHTQQHHRTRSTSHCSQANSDATDKTESNSIANFGIFKICQFYFSLVVVRIVVSGRVSNVSILIK